MTSTTPSTPQPSRPPTAASDFSFGQAAADADPLPVSVRSSVASFAQQNLGVDVDVAVGNHKRNDSGYDDGELPEYDDESDTLPSPVARAGSRAGSVRGKAGVVLGLSEEKGGEELAGKEGEWVDEEELVGEEGEEEEEEDLGPVVEESWLFDGVLERNVNRESERAKGEVAAAAGGKRIGFDVGGERQGGLKERKSVLGMRRVRHGSVEERSAGVGTRVWIGYD